MSAVLAVLGLALAAVRDYVMVAGLFVLSTPFGGGLLLLLLAAVLAVAGTVSHRRERAAAELPAHPAEVEAPDEAPAHREAA